MKPTRFQFVCLFKERSKVSDVLQRWFGIKSKFSPKSCGFRETLSQYTAGFVSYAEYCSIKVNLLSGKSIDTVRNITETESHIMKIKALL